MPKELFIRTPHLLLIAPPIKRNPLNNYIIPRNNFVVFGADIDQVFVTFFWVYCCLRTFYLHQESRPFLQAHDGKRDPNAAVR